VIGSSDNSFVERRRFPRYPCTGAAEVLVIQTGKSRRWGTVSDISWVGCYVETMYPLPAGAEAQLRFTIAGLSLDIAANVVYSRPTFGMGMDFVVAPEEQWKLSQIMARIAHVDLAPAVQRNWANHEEMQPLMQAALQHLEQAQKELQGGHRAQALQLAENATNEIRQVMKEGEHHPEAIDSASTGTGVAL